MKRQTRIILHNLISAVRVHYRTGKIAKENKMPFEDRYTYALKWLRKFHKDGRITVECEGKENLPENLGGCMFAANHQGAADAVGDLLALAPLSSSFLVDGRHSKTFLYRNVTGMLGKFVDMKNLRSQVTLYKEIAAEMKEGRRFLIFPEAGYVDNKNNLQEFHSTCFYSVLEAKCPIIPIVNYDTWKVFTLPNDKPIHSHVYILPPIYPEEYEGMKRAEVCALVKSRIEEKLSQLKAQNGEITE